MFGIIKTYSKKSTKDLDGRFMSSFLYLRGVATIDIELTSIDINQCDPEEVPKTTRTFDVFRGTHLCQLSTEVSLNRIQCILTQLGF